MITAIKQFWFISACAVEAKLAYGVSASHGSAVWKGEHSQQTTKSGIQREQKKIKPPWT